MVEVMDMMIDNTVMPIGSLRTMYIGYVCSILAHKSYHKKYRIKIELLYKYDTIKLD